MDLVLFLVLPCIIYIVHNVIAKKREAKALNTDAYVGLNGLLIVVFMFSILSLLGKIL